MKTMIRWRQVQRSKTNLAQNNASTSTADLDQRSKPAASALAVGNDSAQNGGKI